MSTGKSKVGKTSKKRVSRSERRGLIFPVGRVFRYLKQGHYTERIGQNAPEYLTAVLDYLTAEIMELAGFAAKYYKKKRINPKHILLAIKTDDELNKLLSNITVSDGGVLQELS